VDERWVSLAEKGGSFSPRANAVRQRAVLQALESGPMRMAELAATLPGSASAVAALARKGVVAVTERRRVRGGEKTTLKSAVAARPERLTQGQTEALAAIARACDAGRGDVVVVDGVTGSGKTEVYLDAIERVRAAGKGALVLVPEISLTAQTVGRFRSRFGDDVAILHSRLSAGERFDQWDMVRQGSAHVVVGARSALFAPLCDVGLIIIDEEHEWTYKQESAPRYHAREVAARMAAERGCALVLGSATPSLEALERCREGVWGGVSWTRVSMPERPGAARLPAVRVVDMTEQFSGGNRSIFSAPLAEALQDVAASARRPCSC
jgi:primosomal protein N' (replication factor Y)